MKTELDLDKFLKELHYTSTDISTLIAFISNDYPNLTEPLSKEALKILLDVSDKLNTIEAVLENLEIKTRKT